MMFGPAVFIDRDGTLIQEASYVADPDGIELVPGTVEAIEELHEAGFQVVTVTNQSGIAKGLYVEEDYHAVAERLAEILSAAGVAVDATYYCPHHPDVSPPCGCRKPSTGMYVRAAADLGIDLRSSYYVGDKVTDVLPALELGGQGILVRTGYGAGHVDRLPEETWVVDDLRSAVERIRLDSGR